MTGQDRQTLIEMGGRARVMYYEHLQYGRWCHYIVKELEAL